MARRNLKDRDKAWEAKEKARIDRDILCFGIAETLKNGETRHLIEHVAETHIPKLIEVAKECDRLQEAYWATHGRRVRMARPKPVKKVA